MQKKTSLMACLALCGSLMLAACQQPVRTDSRADSSLIPASSLIRNAQTGAQLTPDALLQLLSQAPMVIVGEEHTNPAHHDIELWLLKNLQKQRPQGSVLLEMLASDQQTAVNQVKQAVQSGTVMREERIQMALRWIPGWPWPLYREVVLEALAGDYPLLVANINREKVSALYRAPVFPEGKRTTDKSVQDALTAVISLMHNGELSPEQLRGMLSIQQNRDRFMARQLMAAPRPALLIAGGYHASKDVGVPVHLADLNADKPVVLMLSTTGTNISHAQADYIWFVPAKK
ncbi:putative iron-regulated protein [Enterobacter sp. BIGb0383]|uniref:ChaN family lipoprotein n=1 Tax=unclassified Enterobacter TaxID=2608935 RepID=UPI000F4639D7|nr:MULTISPECIES: ChaN family lipoprotein [unclassified Enterobacter]ROP59472.1 putative iron-regulated protein [Enterobacter sp. BIGb0383]ROS09061.1 putative iron-regulated protein [Enterobacter sp. BIGb0359]